MKLAPNYPKGEVLEPKNSNKMRAMRYLRATFFTMFSACASNAGQSTKPPCVYGDFEYTSERGTGRVQRTVLEGNGNMGRVNIVRNLHGGSPQDRKFDGEEVSASLVKSLEDFLADKPDAILTEILHYTEGGQESALGCVIKESGKKESEEDEDIDCFFDALMSKKVRTEDDFRVLARIRKENTTKFLTDEELDVLDKLLYKYGATALYGAMFRDRDITWLTSESIEAWNRYDNADSSSKVNRYSEEREQEVADHVMDYLRRNPSKPGELGKTVHIEYGVSHHFRDNFAAEEVYPTVIEVHYPSETTNRYVNEDGSCDQVDHFTSLQT